MLAGIQILAQACSALDRAEGCRAAIDKDGEVVRSGNGDLLRGHPALSAEIAARSLVIKALKELGVSLQPVGPRGRPGSPKIGMTC